MKQFKLGHYLLPACLNPILKNIAKMQSSLQRLALATQVKITMNSHSINYALGLVLGIQLPDTSNVKMRIGEYPPLDSCLPKILLADCRLNFGDVKTSHGVNVA